MEWAPAECALPTEERPLRVAEFDELFATALRGLERVGPAHLRLRLEGGERTVLDLTARETECCAFFTFTLTADGEELTLDIEVPPVRSRVLDGLAVRAIEAAPRCGS
ncbi:hypothetical protein ACFQVD_31400 [Streptosporangium amethystogenes subsp. fukuiense]|uniref:Uncharacterized protein n=1 Tax=Streptosporangium amethystogenes subsp. fukuiense TaxID=698418 RepID=A0ABW2T871_9ACTN